MESLVLWLWLFLSVSLSGGLSVVHGAESCGDEDDVRIVTFGQSFGRVEICRGGTWGTICADSADEPWGLKNAQVVCRQFDSNVGGALNSVLQNTIPESARATNDTPIHYHNVTCLGYEEKVTDCLLNEGRAEGCTHEWDVAVACKGSLAERGDIRLTGDSSNLRGAVEIYDTSTINWATICPDDWTPQLANAACAQLGFESGTTQTFSFTAPADRVGERDVEEFSCPDTALTLKDCAFDSSLSPLVSDCSAAEGTFAGVICTSSSQPEGSVRLFGANSNSEGRVEILYNGRWGAVCDEFWDRTDGETVCRQLGEFNESFTVDVNPDNEPRFIGESRDKPVWLTNLDCRRSDVSLSTCPRFSTEGVIGYTTFCADHTRDAAVDCASDGSGAMAVSCGCLMTLVLVCLGLLLSSPSY